MHASHDTTLAAHVRTYVRAKDENRPYLMQRVFTETATLEMAVKARDMVFPPIAYGCTAMTEVLVRRFAQRYENVFTFCLCEPPAANAVHLLCGWLVVMSEKDTGHVRVGYGGYDWLCNPKVSPLVDRLTITIERMATFPAHAADHVFDWAERLGYPWCRAGELEASGLPQGEALQAVLRDADAWGLRLADTLRVNP